MRTRLTLAFVILLVMTFWVTAAGFSETGKVGYISSDRVFREYAGASDLAKQYDKDLAEWQTRVAEMKREIDKLISEMQSQELMLSDEAKNRKRVELDNKRDEYERYIEEIWGPDGKASRREIELTKPLVTKIDKILENIGKEEEFDIILDIDESAIVFAKEGLDLTDRVIEELNLEIAPYAETGQKVKLAVLAFKEMSAEAMENNLGRQMSDLLETALIQLGKFERWEGNLGSALVQEGIDKEDEVDEKRAVDVSRIAGNDVVVIGTVNKLGATVEVTVTMIEVRTGTVLTTEQDKTTRSETQEDLLPLVGNLAAKLSQKYMPQ
jgi:outer membrane protein